MRRFVQRFPSLLARNLIHHPPTILRHPKINPRVVVPSLNRVTSRFVFFSSESNSARGSGSDEVVSKEELKKRIQSFLDDGDEDALPDLFEAMMTRKLSGKHDESDDEVMEEVRKYPINDSHKVDDNVESDGDSSNPDVENDDMSDGDSSDSDIESDDLSDGDSDEESDDLSDGDSDEECDDLSDGDSDSGEEFDSLKDVNLSGLDVKIDGLKDVDLSELGIKIGGLKPDHSSFSDSESD
ncbi:clumping factor B isoform X1 [Brassica rapa]|uniref:clumping factor B isoform X1 n=1 Tax=Brassica campestris TaxID=3711 RepID=UPI00142E68BE|nr:clumping factor B isoform X1 [Brassica rapa]